MTNVVNVKVANIRPKYNNLKEWSNDPNNIYIGRKGIVFIDKERYPKQDSIWANPYKINKNKNNDRNQVLQQYKIYIMEKIENEKLYDELAKLKKKNLGCWCYPEPCHGNVLKELIEYYK